ncbi:MAG TPA: GNAT family N-acetyltransferase [Rhodothermales bacterium]|nr:GNAT family N-acetyltransferase [Rhodothermales bacterium]
MTPTIRHEPDHGRFVADVEGGQAQLYYERPTEGLVVFTHTEVPEEAEGGGVGSALAVAGLTWARDEGAQIFPLCPFVAAYVRRHAEWQPLVAHRS